MGQYINPAELVEENGKLIELKASLSETEAQLEQGQKICVVATGVGGRKIALVVNGQNDFTVVSAAPRRVLGVYAVGHYLVETNG